MQKVKEDGIITIEEVKQFDNLLAEFNNKLLELKFKQTKKDSNMTTSMSQSGTFIPQEVLNELKEEIKEKKNDLMLEKKEEIKCSLRSGSEEDTVFSKEVNRKNLQSV